MSFLRSLPKDAKIFDVFASRPEVTESPHKVVAKDIEAVYEAGWNEAALHDVVLVTCIASFMNRFVFGFGIAATDQATYKGAAGAAIASDGYASRFRKLLEEKNAEE
ncbi:MAG: hypothetical protein E2P02_00010 [Acidobacteria bacterium]|nr:MAG: hypothetical protein E2P02_00010 [Acidobacteriota bacterium]